MSAAVPHVPQAAQAPRARRPARRAARAAARDRLRWVRHGYLALVVAAALVQWVFFSRAESNALATLLALAASLAGIGYSLDPRRFRALPVSALILLFYTTTATAGALLVKTVEWSALSDRLRVPVLTFWVLFATQVCLIAADQLYLRARPLHALRRALSRRALVPAGVMQWPSDSQFWVLGLLGCASVMLTGTDHESAATFGAFTAGAKFIRAFGFLKFAPFLIPFRDALSGFPSRQRVPVTALLAYFVVLIGVSFATNSRSTFADAIPTVGICVLLAVGLGRLDLRRVPLSRLVVLGVLTLIGAVVLSRIALAMVVVRDYRYNIDVPMLMHLTLEALFNKEWLDAAKAKMDTSVFTGDYSETYVDSRFFARFLLTKFHDNILYYLSLCGEDHLRDYRAFMWDRLVGTLPDPLLRVFGFDLNKQDLVVSNGDYVVYLVDGWGLGGFKTGSMVAEVYAVYGWAFAPVMIGAAVMLFVFHDAFSIPLLIWNLVGTTAAFGLGAETVTAIPSGIVRGLPQNVLVYLVAVQAVKLPGALLVRSPQSRRDRSRCSRRDRSRWH